MFDSHGSMINVYIMYSDFFLTTSPEHIKLVLATDFANFVKGTTCLKRTHGPIVIFV